LGDASWIDLRKIDVILARKDPPVDSQFLYDTMVLELAQRAGVLVVNDPAALRDANEKLFSLHFPQCIPPTVVARDAKTIKAFVHDHDEVILKPLDGMGGRSIFRSRRGDPNLNVILETLTENGRSFTVAQKYLPEIKNGDSRARRQRSRPADQRTRTLARRASRAGIAQARHDFRGARRDRRLAHGNQRDLAHLHP
jgi:glutathione synthase